MTREAPSGQTRVIRSTWRNGPSPKWATGSIWQRYPDPASTVRTCRTPPISRLTTAPRAGAPNRVIVGGLMIQAVLVALIAAAVGVPLSRIVAQGMPTKTGLDWSAVTQLVVIAVVVGLLASLAAVRRALTTDPAMAFGGK